MENLDEIKLKLIQKIIAVDDIDFMLKLQNVISGYPTAEEPVRLQETSPIYGSKIKLTDLQKEALRQAQEDIKRGNFYSDEEVRKMSEEWLK